ncbi:dienelactone hydrolase [Pacificibacter maritimus]|uniref:Dienelactone hydrolase n=1 Tax=Pacificibacter maritimus TaxID=762213 RepID=A0A3N4UVR1_9RHOB|nr:dienelactone hydrolase family protein [Pacificibacter maritimus]RPE71591.1 dienelactone hydrolase [Pacificibacter maritimus]
MTKSKDETPRDARPKMAVPQATKAPDLEKITLGEDQGSGQIWETFMGNLIARNVQTAILYPFRPPQDKDNGKSVIVLPGGGYKFLSMEHEGFKAARALCDLGFTAYVLAYRTVPTAVSSDAFFEDMVAGFKLLGSTPPPENPLAVTDLDHAIAAVRGLNRSAPIGVLGFSAGARTAIRWLEQCSSDAAIEQVALIYPAMAKMQNVAISPDIFVAIAQDDPVFKAHRFALIDGLLNAGISVDFHLFDKGGHGFGMSSTGTTASAWFEAYQNWLSTRP